MQWVEAAAQPPHHCAVIPYIGNSNAEGGFVDTGTDLLGIDPHVYVSQTACLMLGEAVGMKRGEVVTGIEAQLEQVRGELAEVVAERDELKAKFGAIDILASEGFRARNKPGRPAKKTGVAV